MLENGTVKCGDGFEDYDKRVKMLNGKVIGEYICDDIVELEYDELEECYMFKNCYCGYILDEILSASCLSYDELCKYGNRKPIYLWHITNLKIYDEPKELSAFYHYCGEEPNCKDCPFFYVESNEAVGTYEECQSKEGGWKPLTRPPQSWLYCEEVS